MNLKPDDSADFSNSLFTWRSIADNNIEEYIMNVGPFRMIIMHCGQNTFYVHGDFGEIGGDTAVPLTEAEQFIRSQILQIYDFAVANDLPSTETESFLMANHLGDAR